MFLFVKFAEEGDTVAVVPASWFENGICRRPKKNEVDAFVRNSTAPEEHWSCCPAQIIKCFQTLNEAKKCLPLPEIDSDLNSAESSENRQKPLPKLLEIVVNSQSLHAAENNRRKSPLEPISVLTEPEFVPVVPSIPFQNQTQNEFNQSSFQDYQFVLDSSGENGNSQIFQLTDVSQPNLNDRMSALEVKCDALLEGQSEILKLSTEIKATGDYRSAHASRQLDYIALGQQTESVTLLLKLPFNTLESFSEFDLSLSGNDLKKQQLVNEFKIQRGGSPMDFVRRIMQKLLTDELVLHFSLKGQHNNVAFHATQSYLALIDAVTNPRADPPVTHVVVDGCLKNYFKQTPVRLSKKSGSSQVLCKGKLLQKD